MASKYSFGEKEESFADFQAEIAAQSKTGFNLVELEYVEDKWLGIFSDVAPESVYVSSANDAEFNNRVIDRANQGHKVIDIERVDDTWIGLLSKSTSSSAFFSAADFNEFEEQVPIYQDKGKLFSFELSNVEYGQGQWIATLDKSYNSDVVYDFSDDLTGFEEKVEEQADAGFGISSVEYGEDRWVGVFSESDLETNAFFVDDNKQEFETEFKQRQEAGFELADLEIVAGKWLGVYSKSNAAKEDNSFEDLNKSLTDLNTIRAITRSGNLY